MPANALFSPEFIDLAATVIGIIGVGLILLAYFCIQNGRLSHDDMRFPLLNFTGASLLLLSLLRHWNTPSVVIELFWIAISLHAMVRIERKRRRARAEEQ